VLLQAFAKLLAVVPDAVLAIGGDGERREAFEEQARDLGISERVRFGVVGGGRQSARSG
jgi:glycosyltransferase involved in cell wall biosynthesis